MSTLTLRIVRPDRLVWEGEVDHVILTTHTGEMGVWPLHAPAICALGDGVFRVHVDPDDKEDYRVIISGGYAEITEHEVIVLANHARLSTDVRRDSIDRTIAKAQAELEKLDPTSDRRAYWEEKIAWQNLLLQYGEFPS